MGIISIGKTTNVESLWETLQQEDNIPANSIPIIFPVQGGFASIFGGGGIFYLFVENRGMKGDIEHIKGDIEKSNKHIYREIDRISKNID